MKWVMSSIFLAPLSVFALELSAHDVQKSVIENFPLIHEAQLKKSAAQSIVMSASGEFDTKLKVKTTNRIDEQYGYRIVESSIEKQVSGTGLKVFTGYLQSAGRIPSYTGSYETGEPGEAFLGLSLALLRGRKIDEARFQVLSAELESQMADLDLAIKKNFYVYKGLSAFEKWRLAQAKYGIKQTQLRIATERQVMLDKRVRAGDLERYKLIDNQRSVDKRSEELLSAELELESARSNLSLYVKTPQGAPLALKDYFPGGSNRPILQKQDFSIEMTKLPQSGLIDSEIALSREAEKLGRNQALPSLNFEATTFHRMAPVADYNPTRLQVGVQLEIPLENRKATGKSEAANFKTEALEKRKIYFQAELTAMLEQIYFALKLNLERTVIIEREVKGAQIVADAERRRWQRGDTDLFVVALREQEAAEAEARLKTAEFESAQAELDRKLFLNQFAVN